MRMQAAEFEESIQSRVSRFQAVVPFDPASTVFAAVNLTSSNTDLSEPLMADTAAFSAYMQQFLAKNGADYGIGGYNELRTMYGRSDLFGVEEPRRLHLGLDIWGPADTPVFAPLDATVHSFAFNDAFGDYGATIILEHEQEGAHFYSLYGHLSLKDIAALQIGERITAGQAFAHFGEPKENGHWPPHLHFQLILDMEGKKGDYPGVCKFSEREKYLQNCPDPDLFFHWMPLAIRS